MDQLIFKKRKNRYARLYVLLNLTVDLLNPELDSRQKREKVEELKKFYKNLLGVKSLKDLNDQELWELEKIIETRLLMLQKLQQGQEKEN